MEHSAPHNEPCASAASARLLAAAKTSSKSSNRISAIIYRIIPRKPCRGAAVSPFALRNAAIYIGGMNEGNPKSPVDLELKRLEKRLEELVATLNQVKEEN